AYVLAMARVHLILVMAAGAGRGAFQGGEAGGRFASADVWERMARVTAQLYGVYVALANRAGVEGAVTFTGGSVIVGPDGSVLARGQEEGEAVVEATLDPEEVRRARTPYANIRDDDPRLTMRLLARLEEDAWARPRARGWRRWWRGSSARRSRTPVRPEWCFSTTAPRKRASPRSGVALRWARSACSVSRPHPQTPWGRSSRRRRAPCAAHPTPARPSCTGSSGGCWPSSATRCWPTRPTRPPCCSPRRCRRSRSSRSATCTPARSNSWPGPGAHRPR